MPVVTVQGANASTISLTYDSSANAALASAVGALLDAGIKSALTPSGTGTILPVDRAQTPSPPPTPFGKVGEYVFSSPGVASMAKGYDYVVVSATSANLTSNSDANQRILAGSANLTFNAVAGASGSIIAGSGNNLVTIPVADSGAWLIAMGGGSDTIRALGGGNNTISAGVGTGGTSRITLGGGKSAVSVGGSSTIVGSKAGGSETVTATGTTVVNANGSNLLFLGAAGAGATVLGGTGSATIFGGSGNSYLVGGSAGNNSITAGSGNSTLVGSSAPGVGQDTFHGSSGNATVLSGGGVNHYVAGTGSMAINIDTLSGGYQSTDNQFDFINGLGGGTIIEMGFTSVTQIKFHLIGFAANDTSQLTQNAVIGSDLKVTLVDGTQVTFLNIGSTLTTGANFV